MQTKIRRYKYNILFASIIKIRRAPIYDGIVGDQSMYNYGISI